MTAQRFGKWGQNPHSSATGVQNKNGHLTDSLEKIGRYPMHPTVHACSSLILKILLRFNNLTISLYVKLFIQIALNFLNYFH
jgi:hypothetical protein